MGGPKLIIVGGSSGMGKGAARQAVKVGGEVMICSRSTDKLNRAREQIIEAAKGTEYEASAASRVHMRQLDFTSENEVKAFFSTLPANSYDGLIITALGPAAHGPFLEIETSKMEQMMLQKFYGPYWCAKYGAKMLCNGGGIVFVSGILSQRPGKNCSSLAAANAAIEGLTRALAVELGPKLRVNCLSPGFVDTERFDRMDKEKKATMLESVAASLPLKRVGHPDEIGQALLFLATSSFVTGTLLPVDGGHMLRQYALPNELYANLKTIKLDPGI